MSDYEEEFDANDRRVSRKERKMAVRKDRSKYKKSDQDQLKKHALDEKIPEGLQKGRVLAITGLGILVDSEDVLFQCTLKGALKKENSRIKNLVAVGDFVHFEPKGEKEGTIAYVEERRSILSRADSLQRRKEQLIAVNIDAVLITTSVLLPQLKPPLVDRYIIAAQKGNMQPLIVINKIDLLKNPPPTTLPADLEKERALYEEFLKTYRALGIPLFPVSCTTGEGMEALKQALAGKASVFSGQSGVGKSSLINALIGTSLAVGEIVAKTSKGAHTTSTTNLIPLVQGGFCIDTPGIKSFGLWDLSKQDLQLYFSEINERAPFCKFLDCAHMQEPDCAVKKAVESGEISSLRFASYCALMTNLGEKHRSR